MINKTAVVISSGYGNTGIGKYSKALYDIIKREFRSTVRVFLNHRFSRIEIDKNNKTKFIQLAKIPFEPAYSFQFRCRNKLNNLGDVYFITNEKNAIINVKPKIVTCHDLIMFKYPRRHYERILRYLIYYGLKKADLVLCGSKSTMKDLKEKIGINSKKLVLFYDMLNNKYIPHKKSKCKFLINKYNLSKSKKILFVGSEEPRKNIPALLKIFKEVIDKGNDVELLKIGSAGPLGSRKEMIKLIKSLKITDKVRVLEGIPEKEMPYFYSLADVLVFPSKYEGFGYPTLEAMACGCPVVASNNSSIPEIAKGAGFLLDCGNIEGFANKINEILNNPKLAKKMRRKGLFRSKRFKRNKLDRKIKHKIMEVMRK